MSAWEWIETNEKWLYEFNLQLIEVLVEYDGPYLAIFQDDSDRKFFGVFCDYIDMRHRWMLAPVSGAEIIALKTGTVALLEVFKKRTIWFCDLDETRKSSTVWHTSYETIPEELLPTKGHLLPEFARKPITDFVSLEPETAIIKLDGRYAKQNSLPFRELGHFLLQFQDYWERLSRSSILKTLKEGATDPKTLASLSFVAASEGSVNIHFRSTTNIENSTDIYHSTIERLAQSDERIPAGIAKDLGPVGLKSANQLFSMMHSSELDMLIITPGKSLFVGSEKAGRLAKSIKKTQKVKSNNLLLRGHFCAGRSKKSTHSFEFVDEGTGRTYKGKISPTVWRYTSISIGDSDYFEVEIEAFEKKKDGHLYEMAYTLVQATKIRRSKIIETPEE